MRDDPLIEDPPTQASPAARPTPVSSRPPEAELAQPPRAPAEPTLPVTGAPRPQKGPIRRTRLVVRKIDPWAVMRFSLVFYFCMLLVFLLATALVFVILKSFGVVDNIESVFRSLDINVQISGGSMFRWMFLIGLLATVVASAVTVFTAFLYNLISDVVGGIEILVTEREPRS